MKIITLLRKPLEGSVADNILNHGCGGLNIEGCRVPTLDYLNGGAYCGVAHPDRHSGLFTGLRGGGSTGKGEYKQPTGRWPANFILSHSEGCVLDCIGGCPIKEMDTQSGASRFFMQFQQERKD